MGALVPVLGTISTTLGAVQSIGKAFNTLSGDSVQKRQHEFAIQDLQRQQAQETAEAQASAALQREKIALEAENTETTRLAALRRAVAKRNARFGATGIGGTDGSREAILLGLYNESEDEKVQRENLDTLRYNTIDNNLSNVASRNILEKTQLSEQHQLQSIANSF